MSANEQSQERTAREARDDVECAEPSGTAGEGTPADGEDRLEKCRGRFESSGTFPVRSLLLAAVAIFAALFGGFAAYQVLLAPDEVGGPVVLKDVAYPAEGAEMQYLDQGVNQDEAGISFPLADLQENLIVGVNYMRQRPMPEGYQQAAGGNVLPLLSYVTPAGRLVVATAFCEPCRSTEFHLDGSELVCDVCFTRWDVSTLLGVGGGCFDYPPEQVVAEVEGDTIFVPQADPEAWEPRAYQEAIIEDM